MLQIKNTFLLLFGAIILMGCTAQDAPQNTPLAQESSSAEAATSEGVYEKISPQEFNAKIESGEYIVLDVRTQEEYNDERITEDAMSIDFYAPDFEAKIATLDKERKYLLYCRSGNRSGKTLAMMEESQFSEVLELKGGIGNWSASYPVVQ